LIFTGPVDEFFNFQFGKLPYRCLEFKHETLNQAQYQPVAVVNYPNDNAFTRVTEFKHLTGQEHPKTSIVYEYPQAEGDAYYPIPRGRTLSFINNTKSSPGKPASISWAGWPRTNTTIWTRWWRRLSRSMPSCAMLAAPKRPTYISNGNYHRNFSTRGQTQTLPDSPGAPARVVGGDVRGIFVNVPARRPG